MRSFSGRFFALVLTLSMSSAYVATASAQRAWRALPSTGLPTSFSACVVYDGVRGHVLAIGRESGNTFVSTFELDGST